MVRALDKIMGVGEAATLWGLSPGYIKNLCASGKVEARKIGKTWVLLKDQPNPKCEGVVNMRQETFTVVVKDIPGTPYPRVSQSAKNEIEAIKLAETLVEKYNDQLVFVEYFRPSDGQYLYLNRDGYSLSGESWSE